MAYVMDYFKGHDVGAKNKNYFALLMNKLVSNVEWAVFQIYLRTVYKRLPKWNQKTENRATQAPLKTRVA